MRRLAVALLAALSPAPLAPTADAQPMGQPASLPALAFDYEYTQRAHILQITLVALGSAAAAFGVLNGLQGATTLALSLWLLSALCIVGLYLNYHRHFVAATSIISVLALLVMGYNLIDGAALHDPGIAAYPVFILCVSFFLGKRAIGLALVASIGSVVLLYLLARYQVITPAYPPTLNRVQILSILFLVTAYLAWTMVNVWEKTLLHVQEAYDMTLKGWSRAIEYRDGETEGHSKRVMELCVALARRFGYTEDQITHVRRGAYLHDIGKMGIPDRILNKNGPLDDAERQIMQQHPVLALEMLAGIPFLEPALVIPYSHHEYWNGSGYPQGLKGAEIPLTARLFTVVDQWDALSSDRPYRKAWPTDQIIAYMHENAGKLYDPEVVQVFLELIQERALIATK